MVLVHCSVCGVCGVYGVYGVYGGVLRLQPAFHPDDHLFDAADYFQVGASLSMVYKTRQPIVFVGNGQHYTNLHVLNVGFVVRALLS